MSPLRPLLLPSSAMLLLLLLLLPQIASAEQLAAPQRLRVEDLDPAVAVLSEPVPRFSFAHLPVGRPGDGTKNHVSAQA